MLKIGLIMIVITSFNIPLSLMIFFIAYPDQINFNVEICTKQLYVIKTSQYFIYTLQFLTCLKILFSISWLQQKSVNAKSSCQAQ